MESNHYFSSYAEHGWMLVGGLPVLMYHKIGRRPRNAKLRSLYLSPQSFARQLDGLAAVGYASATLDEPRPVPGDAAMQKKIVLTFDDGYANVLKHALGPMARHNFKAMQFLVAGRLGGSNEWDVAGGEVPEALMDAAQVRAWLAAGHAIGSHTLTHPHLSQIALAAQREEIFSSKKKLEDLFGVPCGTFAIRTAIAMNASRRWWPRPVTRRR